MPLIQKNCKKLMRKQHDFNADIEGEFPEKAYPAEMGLTLKVGAQVMFIKNDTSDRGKTIFQWEDRSCNKN